MADAESKSIDKATIEMIEKAASDGVNTAYDRAETTRPCPIGMVGSCCKHCGMGPCRVPLPKGRTETPEAQKIPRRSGLLGRIRQEGETQI